MNENESDIILKLNDIVDRLLSGKNKFAFDTMNIDGIEDENLKSLAGKIVHLAEQYKNCYGFMMDLSYGRLNTEPPRMNVFANPFKQLHSELLHLTWQIQEIANGDYDQCVSFSGDFSDAINKMIIALRERQMLSEQIMENENLFRTIFRTSPDGIVLCDLNHCIMNASNAAYRMLQITDENNGKMYFNDLIHTDDSDKFKWSIDSLLNGSSITVFAELRIVPPNGINFWSEQNASLFLDSHGVAKGYIIIIRNITERKIAEAQLLQYTDIMNESNVTKDKLFSIIAHDLRSPFSALLGTSKILVQETAKEDASVVKIRKLSNILNDTVGRTYDLLINLLEWSRLQSDRLVVKPEELNMSNIIMDNVSIGQTMAMGKNIMLKYTTSGDYYLVSDKAIINTVLRNLISNAIKYTPQNGLVLISLVKKDDIYYISVKDSGVGISAENIEKLFGLNTIQSTPGTANEKGTGLGLVLCKDFVNKLGGDIWVESTYGHGATFTFSLKNLPMD